MPADGGGSPEALFKSPNRIGPRAWTHNGKDLALAYTETSSVSGEDIWVLDLNGDRKSHVVVNAPGDQLDPQFSGSSSI
jgi:Tol biopolymer transport system component